MKTQVKLLAKYMPSIPKGRVEWIGLRPERKASMQSVSSTTGLLNRGLDGDRQAAKSSSSARQVTLISQEDIQAIGATLGLDAVDPALLRRNVVVSGINLHTLRYHKVQIGECILELGAHCHPCSRMESALGTGGFLAMYMRGGYCAKVIQEGRLSIGDKVNVLFDG